MTVALGAAPPQRNTAPRVPRWTRFETALTASREYANPTQDVRGTVEFASPSGKRHVTDAFWDGARTWRVRFAPDETGNWTFRTEASNESDRGLHGVSGGFRCVAYAGANQRYRAGMLGVSRDRWHLESANGTPFFWLADTAWNGVLLSHAEDWDRYLSDRAGKGFTAIQFVTTQWRAGTGDADGRPAYIGADRIAIDPRFYQRMDARIDAINAHGLIAAPVLLWANHRDDPGLTLADDQAILLARYMVARYGAHHVVWMLGGDSDYRGEKAERWRRIGRAVFGNNVASGGPPVPKASARLAEARFAREGGSRTGQPVTMHPRGMQLVSDEFRAEPWFSFSGYQSGHGDNEATLRWLTEGPPAREWSREPHHPLINLEPNYEAHLSYHSRQPFDAHAVRRAAYWSLLVAPPAGVTYGAHGIWSWQAEPGEPLNHKGTGTAPPWQVAMALPGSIGMKHLASFFGTLRWWTLGPAQDLLAEQPGRMDAERFVAVARTQDGSTVVAYLPRGGTVAFGGPVSLMNGRARWFDPREGRWSPASSVERGRYDAPSESDWLLVIQRGRK